MLRVLFLFDKQAIILGCIAKLEVSKTKASKNYSKCVYKYKKISKNTTTYKANLNSES